MPASRTQTDAIGMLFSIPPLFLLSRAARLGSFNLLGILDNLTVQGGTVIRSNVVGMHGIKINCNCF